MIASAGAAVAADAAAREVADAFLAAPGRGDLAGLAPEVELGAQGPAGTVVIRGADQVAAQAKASTRRGALAHPVLVDGIPGVLITAGGRLVTVMAFTVTGGAVTAIRALTDPGLLAQVVPSWVTDRKSL